MNPKAMGWAFCGILGLAVAWAARSLAADPTAIPPTIDIEPYLAAPGPTVPTDAARLPPELQAIRRRLIEEVRALVDGPRLAPLRVEIGLAGCEYAFDQSGETFAALSLAAPHLPAELQARVLDYLRGELQKHPPHTEGCWYALDQGRRRERYRLTEDMLRPDHRQRRCHPMANLYALWAFAHRFDQWSAAAARWPEIEASLRAFEQSGWRFDPAKGDLFANAYLAGLMGYVRIARRLEHAQAADRGAAKAAELASRIVAQYRADAEKVFLPEFDNVSQFDRWREEGAGGFFWKVAGHKAKPAKFHGLTPEVGRLLADHAATATAKYLAFVDRSLPGWFLAGEERQFHYGENFIDFPDFSLDLFQARAWIERAPAAKLARWVDLPWCSGDLFYVRKLALVLDAASATR